MSFASGFFLTLATATPPFVREHAPTNWPIERIIENLEARLTEDPNDAEVHYNLGRAHAFAFALERPSLFVVGGNVRLFVKDLHDQPERAPFTEDPPWIKPEDSITHLSKGIEHLRRASEVVDERPATNARRALTLAWLLETGAHLADRVDSNSVLRVRAEPLTVQEREKTLVAIERLGDATAKDDRPRQFLLHPSILERALTLLYTQTASSNSHRQRAVCEILQQYWLERAIAEYWRTLQLSFDMAGGKTTRPEWGTRAIAAEASNGYRRLVEARGVRESERERLAEVRRIQEQLDALPSPSWITPIVISLDPHRGPNDLVRLERTAQFDLDGDGNAESWPWLAPNAGWLVWDPMRESNITSGRQLFGSASAWLLFDDGYRVLDALDDDRDQRLSGVELCGLAVWFDRDSNGVSDRTEVIPAEELGIVGLSTRPTQWIDGSPANECGLELADGRVLPTYDWVLSSIAE